MVYKFLLILFVTISFSQRVKVIFRSYIGKSEIIINNTITYKTPISLNLTKGDYTFRFINSKSNLDHLIKFDLQKNVTFIVNKEMDAFVRVNKIKKEELNHSNRIEELFVEDGYETKKIDLKQSNSGISAHNHKAESVTLSHEDFKSKQIDVPGIPFFVTDVVLDLELKGFAHNKYIKKIEDERKSIRNTVSYSLAGVTAILGYMTFSSIGDVDTKYDTYLNAKTNAKISSSYKDYQSARNSVDSYATYTVISATLLTYVLFFETWTDLSDEYVDEKEESAFKFNVAPNQVGVTFNF